MPPSALFYSQMYQIDESHALLLCSEVYDLPVAPMGKKKQPQTEKKTNSVALKSYF